MKAKHFLNGLKPQYITQLAPLDIQTYDEMVKKAQLLEDAADFTDRIKGKFVKKELTSGQSSSRPNNGKKCPLNLTEGPSQERKPKAIVPYTLAKSNCKHCDKHVVDAYRGYLSTWVPQFPTEPVTSEAHPYSPQARARRRFLYRRPVRSRDVAVLAQRLQHCSFSFFYCTCCTSGRTRVKHVTGLTGLDEAFHHSWYQSKAVVMADRRDCGGGGDDPEESTQRMIERI
ncbi:hypothetical protein Taro_031691 [Colocasia esculenta]|uniref:Uncharacterized protein n=1 Tax=Colocasia esculenta TaxID=4460 RepID=A0A843W1N7_COLES|nr:hypothetical protein [Colocasia esculenta]